MEGGGTGGPVYAPLPPNTQQRGGAPHSPAVAGSCLPDPSTRFLSHPPTFFYCKPPPNCFPLEAGPSTPIPIALPGLIRPLAPPMMSGAH